MLGAALFTWPCVDVDTNGLKVLLGGEWSRAAFESEQVREPAGAKRACARLAPPDVGPARSRRLYLSGPI